jgi:hypothetical protein
MANDLHEVRAALGEAVRRLNDARLLHAMRHGPAPGGLEEDVEALQAEEDRLQQALRA